jgi:hypothetical protein
MGSFEAKKTKSKISRLGTFKEETYVLYTLSSPLKAMDQVWQKPASSLKFPRMAGQKILIAGTF